MPGIAGIIGGVDADADAAKLGLMLRTMLHEDYYTSGSFGSPGLGVQVGWTDFRGSFSDCLPIWNERQDVALIFSGRHYGEPQELKRLKGAGHEWQPGNASYLVHWYEEDGESFLSRLNGWFSGLVLDLRQRKAILFNDRFGLNRLYCHQSKQGFHFASEAKALLRVLPELRRLDERSLGEYLSCGCPLQNRSLFTGIDIVPPGSKWSFAPGSAVPTREFHFRRESWENQEILPEAAYYERLKEAFGRVVQRYAGEDERVGISLTGGVDSRLIMAWLPGNPGRFPCYTFVGTYRECTDVVIARKVAELARQPFRTIEVGEAYFPQFPRLAEKTVYVTDGAMDVSGASELFTNSIARGIAPIRLTGNYGGEVLRGIVAFKPSRDLPEVIDPGMARSFQAAAETYREELNCRIQSFIAFKQVPWHHYSRLNLERSQLDLRSPYLDNELVGLVFQCPHALTRSKTLSMKLIEDGNPAMTRFETDRGISFRLPTPGSRIRRGVQEFFFKAEYAYDYGMPQWVCRADGMLRRLHLERLFLGRHKFAHYRIWYRDQFGRYLREVLLDPRTRNRSFLRGAVLERMVKAHVSGRGNYTTDIHRVLSMELLHRQLLEGGGFRT